MPDRRRLAVIAIAAALLVGAAAGTWYLFLRPGPPPAVGLPDATPTPGVPSPGVPSPGVPSPGVPSPAASPDGSAAPDGEIAGAWVVDDSIGSFADFSGSFVGYRVREELATIGATEAVGRTPNVTGLLTVEGTTLVEATIGADLTSLRSDSSNRDNQLRRQALETERYPRAEFRLTEPVDLAPMPRDGGTFQVTVTGDLTLHGQTREVRIPLEARMSGAVVTIVGSLRIPFADFGIEQPRAMIVLSVEDVATLELQLHFRRQ